MKDLVSIFKILNVCADRIEDHPVYIEPMIEMLKLCRFPFLKEKSSDEISYEQIATESVSQLGKIYINFFMATHQYPDVLVIIFLTNDYFWML